MEEYTESYCGTLRISNPNTLQRWIDNGKYQQQLNDGYIFNPYCGRFKNEKCTCSKCKNEKPNKDELIKILKTTIK
jgi:hypothetical protein